MADTRISDVVVPEEFTAYIVQNSMAANALVQSGVMVPNGVIGAQLAAGSDSFTVPNWFDLGDDEADVVSDDPAVDSTPRKLSTGKQVVRKSYLHNSWSAMNLASELAGSDAMMHIQARAAAYWSRQAQKRLVASLNGILADNVANDSGDMILDIHGATNADVTDATKFSAASLIDATKTLGDALKQLTAVAMHSDTYRAALKNDLIATLTDSQGVPFQTFRGLAVVVDDGLPYTPAAGALTTDAAAQYTTILFGAGAVGYGVAEPNVAAGTEIENKPSAGNGGGQQILHSRLNLTVHPAGFSWLDGSGGSAIAGASPTLAELAAAAHWNRVFERKAVRLAFLKHN